ncbi:hypothetical protein AVEN_78535-1 [Araneus ventricosus]|uniref:Uncharacterized protein n=1 Tax=Araneus ventricosus TaxID=182803 RepID=A0A4Y2EQ60_ARAVE|nr:hypothetical protein AVEN_78535-1 [Araneus ventricosus]
MDKWLKTETLKRSASRTEIRTTAAMEITVDQKDDNHEVQMLTDWPVQKKGPCSISWRHPPAHSWNRSEGPDATIHFKGDRKDQTALARLSSGHLKTLRFSCGDKNFNICTKCNMTEATPQHLFDCVALVYADLIKLPDFVLEVMKANNLMDLI